MEFKQVQLVRTTTSLGCVAQRNRGAELCSGKVIFSINDDAEFSTSRVVEQVLAGFAHPRVAAIAIPYVEPLKSGQKLQHAPNADAIWITDSFRGTAYALRRDVFLDLAGYREQIVHQGEEMDFCIRLLNEGFVVGLGFGDAIVHHEFPQRDWRQMDFYRRRNDVLFAWRNVPMPIFQRTWWPRRSTASGGVFAPTPRCDDSRIALGLFGHVFGWALASPGIARRLSPSSPIKEAWTKKIERNRVPSSFANESSTDRFLQWTKLISGHSLSRGSLDNRHQQL